MLQSAIELVQNHPVATTTAGVSTLILSEILGFTRRGGILRVLCDVLIALGVAAKAFKKVHTGNQEPPAR